MKRREEAFKRFIHVSRISFADGFILVFLFPSFLVRRHGEHDVLSVVTGGLVHELLCGMIRLVWRGGDEGLRRAWELGKRG